MSMKDEIEFRGMKYEYKGTTGNGCMDCEFLIPAGACEKVNEMLGGDACPITSNKRGPSWQFAKLPAPPQACA